MKDKARSNLEAARLLTAKKHFDSAASRAYYAAYLMAWHVMERRGKMPSGKAKGGGRYWPHHSFPATPFDGGCLNAERREEWEWLYGLRIKADYCKEGVEEARAAKAVEVALTLIESFSKEGEREP
ncbi:MAG: hypothetical protein HY894_08535 [Deltaproteobacteria bacterium]|nr:hypothetical protein [Deltaproteobacteria bacterium]